MKKASRKNPPSSYCLNELKPLIARLAHETERGESYWVRKAVKAMLVQMGRLKDETTKLKLFTTK